MRHIARTPSVLIGLGIFGLGAALGVTAPASAGIVSSGGGVLYEETANPWFLENTESVNYCLDIDTEHVHLNPELIRARVQDAIIAWKTALKAAAHGDGDPELKPWGQVRLATQQFKEEACSDATDLRLQFGRLSEDQRRFLPNPRHYVATTVRTSYDEVSLRGKGFIYISPDSGPLRPTSNTFAEAPWSVCDGCILQRAVMHELGHVFGLSHDGGSNDLMGARHLEVMTQAKIIKAFQDPSNIPDDFFTSFGTVDVFGFPARYLDNECHDDQPWRVINTFFHIPASWSCVHIVIAPGAQRLLEVYAAPKKGDALQLQGFTSDHTGTGTFYSSDDMFLVKLNPRQQVFTATPDHDPNAYIEGLQKYQSEYSSLNYRSLDASYSVPVLLRLQPNSHFQVIGAVDGVVSQILEN